MHPWQNEALSHEERARLLTDELTTEEQAAQLSYNAPAVPRLGIPAYNWWNEGLHGLARAGTATVFPQAIGLAASFDRELVKKAAEVASQEARAKYNAYRDRDRDIYKGLTLWSPNINIFRDPRWGRGHETYGEDPYLTAELGISFVKGLQGEGEVLRTAACAKHFAVHSGPEALRHGFDARVSPKDMEETYLPAFKALVEAGAEGVMGAYNRVNGEPACASDFLMSKLRDWGFEGYFVSDCWAVQDFHANHHVTKNPVESAAMAVKAGCDLNCGCTYAHLLAALDEGLIDRECIRTACIHVMRTRMRLGMFDNKTEYDNIPYSAVCSPEHEAAALRCSLRSFVLLENNGILPLNKDISSIAVIGPNADSRTALEGNYCGRSDRYITFLQGLQEEFDGRIFYSEGCHLYKDRISGLALPGDRYAEAEECAKAADISIIFTGLDATLEGEEGDTGNEFSSGDKESLSLPHCQQILIEKIAAIGKPYIIVNVSGSSINFLPQKGVSPSAAIQAFYPGAAGGRALAQLLFGKNSPSGKLPVTFYKSAELLPEFTDYSMKNRTYRFLEDNANVLYPFGWGLTYGNIVCERVAYKDGYALVDVKNPGGVVEDVIEIYIKGNDEFSPKNASLCGFERICLEAGEGRCLEIPLSENAFTSVNHNGERGVYSKSFTLYAGTHAPDELSESLSGNPCAKVNVVV